MRSAPYLCRPHAWRRPETRDRVGRHMLALTTYMGHTCVASTYWYLESTPHLMVDIAEPVKPLCYGGTVMTPIAPHITAFLRERLPLPAGRQCPYVRELCLYVSTALDVREPAAAPQPSALCLEHLDAALVMAFLAHLEAERGNSPRTRNTRLAAIKSFWRFLEYRVPSLLEHSRRCWPFRPRKPLCHSSPISPCPRCTPFSRPRMSTHARAYKIGPCCIWALPQACGCRSSARSPARQ